MKPNIDFVHRIRSFFKRFRSLKSEERPRELAADSCFVDEDHNLILGSEAVLYLQSKNDEDFLEGLKGIVEVDHKRWEEAQRYEYRSWMEGNGLNVTEDRNSEHEEMFDEYRVLDGRSFENAIEIGCGPFTNIIRLLRRVRCDRITLLDPLIDQYLRHPNCSYKQKQMDGHHGKIQTIALPLEEVEIDQTYDLVIVINVLEHCFSAQKFFDQIVSLTAPGGILVFHDKLIRSSEIERFVSNVYDAGHPLRVADKLILDFLFSNYSALYDQRVGISSPIGTFDSIYFIGEKVAG